MKNNLHHNKELLLKLNHTGPRVYPEKKIPVHCRVFSGKDSQAYGGLGWQHTVLKLGKASAECRRRKSKQ